MESGLPAKRVLFIVTDLEHSGTTRQLSLLAGGLPRDRYKARVVALGTDGPVANCLRSADIEVEALGWTRWLDAKPFWRLRQVVRQFSPDIIHAWRISSLRAVAAVRRGRLPLLVSDARAARQPMTFTGCLDHLLLCRAELVLAGNAAEAERYRRLGLTEKKIAIAAPGVGPVDPWPTDQLRCSLGLPQDTRLIVCVGPLEPDKGYRDALWAFDMVKFLYDNLHLVLIGEGSDRRRLEAFARNLRGAAAVHFAGRRADVPSLLTQADLVWVPSRQRGGVNCVLEAMAAGRPAVANLVPNLADIVIDGATGFLVAPGDHVSFARQTRKLLDDPIRRQAMGEAGKKRALSHFSARNLVDRVVSLYDQVSGEWYTMG
jgi:glycosyltransferase involved in cell wall biosynthesis